MRPHKAKDIVSKIDKYLPSTYTDDIIERCKEADIVVNSQKVRYVKNFIRKDAAVLKVILEFAREKEKEHKELEAIE
jgi:deoxyribose-phosphate aldolase